MEKISIELPAQTWNVVLTALGQRPYSEVFELIEEIRRQAVTAINSKTEETEKGHA